MPNQSQRSALLRQIERRLDRLRPWAAVDSSILEIYISLLGVHERISSTRYLERHPDGPGYRKRDTNIMYKIVRESRPARMRRMFRMNFEELFRINDLYKNDPVFQSTGKKPQTPSIFQLAVAINRLAQGHESDTIAELFGISKGSVDVFTRRSIIAITRTYNQHVFWPDEEERSVIKGRIRRHYAIPHCLGYIDGTHINLYKAPSKGTGNATSFYTRKHRYGLLVVAVVDDLKRFRFVQWGFSASASDQRAQRTMSMTSEPYRFFDDKEYVIGGSGFTNTSFIIAMFRKHNKESHLYGEQAFFNAQCARARAAVEHAFGILKARWQALSNLRCKCGDQADEAFAQGMVQAAMVLHNLLVRTWKDNIGDQELRETMTAEEAERIEAAEMAAEAYRSSYDDDGTPAGKERREELIKEMLELDPPSVPVEDLWI